MRNGEVLMVSLGIIFMLLSFIAGMSTEHERLMRIWPTVHDPDTVYVMDTVREAIPEPYEVTITEYVYVPVMDSDTIHLHDTVMLPLPKEQKTYTTPEYTAIVSGIFPSLDYIETYNLTRTITRTVTEKEKARWAFSVGAGPGVIYSPFTKGVDAGIGIWGGVTYNF